MLLPRFLGPVMEEMFKEFVYRTVLTAKFWWTFFKPYLWHFIIVQTSSGLFSIIQCVNASSVAILCAVNVAQESFIEDG